MFTRLHLENFRSFGDLTIDLSEKNGNAKKVAVIYGENGAGKSNLSSAFVLLRELASTMNVRDMYEEILNQKAIFADENMETLMRQRIKSGMRDMQAIIDDYRMVGNDEPISVEYEFALSGHTGKYCVSFGKDEVIYERLDFLLNKRRGTYFECSDAGISINPGILKSKDLLKDIKGTAKRFWGKHTLIAIFIHELMDKSNSYGLDNVLENFNNVLAFLTSPSCYVKIGSRRWDKLVSDWEVLESADIGEISVADERQLDIAERIFSSFFSAINSDIRRVYYRRTANDKLIKYELVVEKMISGQYRHVDFSRESTGNHQVLRVLCYLLTACMGDVVIIDEADSAVHDYLFKKVFDEVTPYIHGQVIMTTHNTMLMEYDSARDTTYILSEDDLGNKTVRAISDYEKRTYFNNNIRNKYLNNDYGGLPKVTSIDFESIIGHIHSLEN